jgi:chromosome segregation ATPase
LASDCNEFRSQVEQLRRENESLQTLAKDHQSRAEWLETELEAVNSQTHRSKAEMEALRYATDVAVKESDGLREHSRQLESELSTLRTEHLSLTQTQAMDLGGSKRKIESLEAELKGVRQDLENREKQLIAAQQEKAQLKAELDSSGTSLVGDLAQARAYIADLDRELATLRSQGSASEELMLEMDALRQQLAGVEREASELAAENRRLQQELVRRPDPSFAEDLAGEGSAGVSARPHEELERLQANWQASEEARFELTRRLEAEHEQAEQRLLAMRQQLEAERSQMKQLVMQAAAEHDRTRAEMEALRQQVGSGGMIQSSDEAIQQELNYLRTRLQEFESAFPGDGSAGTSPDLAQYEEQLEQYRADLEQAQAELSQREQELETERQNVHEKLRQAELDISRERATFAREKAELDRLRREFLAEVEHTERESSARARLAPLDRLASEVKGRVKEAANVPQQPSLSDRLRSFMKRSPDGPTKSDG